MILLKSDADCNNCEEKEYNAVVLRNGGKIVSEPYGEADVKIRVLSAYRKNETSMKYPRFTDIKDQVKTLTENVIQDVQNNLTEKTSPEDMKFVKKIAYLAFLYSIYCQPSLDLFDERILATTYCVIGQSILDDCADVDGRQYISQQAYPSSDELHKNFAKMFRLVINIIQGKENEDPKLISEIQYPFKSIILYLFGVFRSKILKCCGENYKNNCYHFTTELEKYRSATQWAIRREDVQGKQIHISESTWLFNRGISFSQNVYIELFSIGMGVTLSPEIRNSVEFISFKQTSGLAGALINDIISLKKEINLKRDFKDKMPDNLVWRKVVVDGFAMDEALTYVNNLINEFVLDMFVLGDALKSFGDEALSKYVDIVKCVNDGTTYGYEGMSISRYQYEKLTYFEKVPVCLHHI